MSFKFKKTLSALSALTVASGLLAATWLGAPVASAAGSTTTAAATTLKIGTVVWYRLRPVLCRAGARHV